MKFYILETDPVYGTYPKIKGNCGKMDIRYMNKEQAYRLPKRYLLPVYEGEFTVFTSIVSYPFMMVSEEVKSVFDIYEPHITYKQLVLLDSKFEKSQLYYIPILDEVSCLAEGSQFNLNRSILKHGIIDYERTEGKAVFRLGDVSGYYVVVRLDLAESILKRDVIGVGLRELDVINDRRMSESVKVVEKRRRMI